MPVIPSGPTLVTPRRRGRTAAPLVTNAWSTGQTNGFPMGIQNIVNVNVPLASYAQPGGFNDPT
jgi:hypothetical protein